MPHFNVAIFLLNNSRNSGAMDSCTNIIVTAREKVHKNAHEAGQRVLSGV